MIRIPTVKIRNPKTGRCIQVNQDEWAQDLGTSRWAGYTLVSESGGDHVEVINSPAQAEPAQDPEIVEGAESPAEAEKAAEDEPPTASKSKSTPKKGRKK